VPRTRRDVRLSEGEAWELVSEQTKVQVATNGPDGWPHLVTLFHTVLAGSLVFWTYARSQKISNLERDPRLTCLVEAGEDYAELRGVQIVGRARVLRARDDIHAVGHAVVCRMLGLDHGTRLDPAIAAEVARQAEKRVAVEVEPHRLRSWDHRKLAGAPGQATR
jgi:nitroimidazol reductase NimA-like FMN-containing flavoprotein (pyridoxamine 5'-phosphate oxidase superfamily)